jgi:hypothetical protein
MSRHPITSNIVPFALETPFSFDSDRSATHDRYLKISIANEDFMSFLAVLKLFHACFYNRFENTPISSHANHS